MLELEHSAMVATTLLRFCWDFCFNRGMCKSKTQQSHGSQSQSASWSETCSK